MRAFHNDLTIKEHYLARVRQHQALDEIIQGTYWEEGKGCAIGCTIHGKRHHAYEQELGIPVQLAYLQDKLFEGMSASDAKSFPLAFLEAIQVGADLQFVGTRLMLWILDDIKHLTHEVVQAWLVQTVIYLECYIRGEIIDEDFASAFSHELYVFANNEESHVAYAVSYAFNTLGTTGMFATDMITDVVRCAVNAITSEAYQSDDSALYSHVKHQAYKAIADQLLVLLKEAK